MNNNGRGKALDILPNNILAKYILFSQKMFNLSILLKYIDGYSSKSTNSDLAGFYLLFYIPCCNISASVSDA
jgi:hypothetical protein